MMCAVCLGYPEKKKDSNEEEREIYTLLNVRVHYFLYFLKSEMSKSLLMMNLFFRRSNYIQTFNHSELWVIIFTSSSDIYLFIYVFGGWAVVMDTGFVSFHTGRNGNLNVKAQVMEIVTHIHK